MVVMVVVVVVVVGNGLDDSGSSDSPFHGMPRELVLFEMPLTGPVRMGCPEP